LSFRYWIDIGITITQSNDIPTIPDHPAFEVYIKSQIFIDESSDMRSAVNQRCKKEGNSSIPVNLMRF
jgi:hypothetical protein